MKLIITTYNYIGIYDTNSKKMQKIHKNEGKYFEISWDQNLLYATVGVRLNKGEDYGEKTEYILTFNKNFECTGKLFDVDIDLNNVHQLQVWGDKMYIANSGKNNIKIVNLDTKKIKTWYPNFTKRGSDINHFNSIMIYEDKFYILAHNNDKPSYIREYTFPNFKKIREYHMGNQAHNLYREGNQLFVCDSKGSANVIGSSGGELKIGDGYVRGLAVSNDSIFVGTSKKATREER